MAASPSSAYTRVPEDGQAPDSTDASVLGTLRTLVIRTRSPPAEADARAPVGAVPAVCCPGRRDGGALAATVPATVRPGATSGTVCLLTDIACPDCDRCVNVTV